MGSKAQFSRYSFYDCKIVSTFHGQEQYWHRALRQMFFDLAIITTSVSAGEGGVAIKQVI